MALYSYGLDSYGLYIATALYRTKCERLMAPVVEHSLRSIDWRLTRATERSGAYVARNSHSLPSEVGHNYAGHNCIAHNYIGHDYTGEKLPQPSEMPTTTITV